MVACYRAIAAGDPNPETRKPDYLAETLWDPELMALVPACADLQRPFDEVRADYVHRQAIVPFFVVARTKFIDQSLQASLAEGVRLAGCPRNDDRHLGRPTAPRFTGQRSLGRHDDRPRRDSNFFTLGVSMSLTAPTRSSQFTEKIGVGARGTLGGLTQFLRTVFLVGAKPLKANGDRERALNSPACAIISCRLLATR
jgi:hypothetical protein